MNKPRILVARAIFPDIVDRLREHFDVEDNPSDVIWSPQELAARLADKDGVLTTGSQRIDAALLAAAPRLQICANMAVGYNNFDVDAMTAAGQGLPRFELRPVGARRAAKHGLAHAADPLREDRAQRRLLSRHCAPAAIICILYDRM